MELLPSRYCRMMRERAEKGNKTVQTPLRGYIIGNAAQRRKEKEQPSLPAPIHTGRICNPEESSSPYRC